MAGMRIDLDLGSEENYTRPFDAMLRKLDQLENRWRGAMGNMAASSRGIPSGRGGGGAGSASGSTGFIGPQPLLATVAAPPTLDELARYYKIQNKVSGGAFEGVAKSFAQQAYDYAKTQYDTTGDPRFLGQMNRWASAKQDDQPKGFMDKLKDVFYSSRFGENGQMMPLLGKFAGLLGIGALQFGIAIQAVRLFGQALEAATQIARQYTSLISVSGGNMRNIGGLIGYGAALGMDPTQLAQRVQSSIGSGGYGASYAASLGVNPMGGPFGDINYAGKANKILSDIMNSRDMETALRKSEMLGMPELAQLQNLSPMAKFTMGASMQMSESDVRTFQEFNMQFEIFKNNLGVLLARFLTPFLEKMNAILTLQNMVYGGWQIMLETTLKYIRKAMAVLTLGMSEVIYGRLEKTIDKNTNAVDGLRKSIEGRETLGGGDRARNAIPSGVNGLNLGDRWYRAALDTGTL